MIYLPPVVVMEKYKITMITGIETKITGIVTNFYICLTNIYIYEK
jgi:hypothetical protein